MNRLIDAFKGVFDTASISGGELAKTANFILENVDWSGEPSKPEPMSHPVVDTFLEAACSCSGEDGSTSRKVATALLAVSDQLAWRAYSTEHDNEPDIAVFAPRFSAMTVVGAGGLLPADKVTAGFSLQGPDTYYPPHAHYAEESYWIIGGHSDWKVDAGPWFAVEAGDSIYHAPEARHAMQTNEEALLTIWLWTSHLDSEVVFVRA